MDFEFGVISAVDHDRIGALHEPLAESVRRLIEASLHSGADADTVMAARQTIDEVNEMLEHTPSDRPRVLRHEGTGLPVVWRNPAVGRHNPLAPPMNTHHEDGRVWTEFTGTITLKYLRGTPLGALRGEAWVERTEGLKTYARGFLGDAQGATVEAEGAFIMPVWAREAG